MLDINKEYILALYTDGVSDNLFEEQITNCIQSTLREYEYLEKATHCLVDTAYRLSQDN